MVDEFINVNLEDVDDGTDPIPEGTPGCEIIAAEYKRKEGGEYPYLELRLHPCQGQVEDKFLRRSAWLTLSFSPRALWNMKLVFKALRRPLKLEGLRPDELCRSLIGGKFRPTISINGDRRNEVGPPYHVFE